MTAIDQVAQGVTRPIKAIARVREPAVVDPTTLRPGDPPPTNGRLLVLYDGGCGICLHARDLFARWDNGRALNDDMIARHDDFLLANMSQEETYGSFHVIHPDGRVESGGDGLATVIGALRFGGPLAAAMRRFSRASNGLYDWFVAHRAGISQTTGLINHPQRDPSQQP